MGWGVFVRVTIWCVCVCRRNAFASARVFTVYSVHCINIEGMLTFGRTNSETRARNPSSAKINLVAFSF